MLTLKLCLAQGLKCFHEQVSAVLKAGVDLRNVAPELVSIDRQNLGRSIDLQLNLMTKKEQDKNDQRILREFPSQNYLARTQPADLVVSPPGTGGRQKSEPLASIKDATNTPNTKNKKLLGTISEGEETDNNI